MPKNDLQTNPEENLPISNDDLIDLAPEKNIDQLSDFFNILPINCIKINISSIILDVNPAAAKFLGLDISAMINKNISRYLTAPSQVIFAEFVANCFLAGTTQLCEIQFLNAKGPIIDTQVEGRIIEQRATGAKELFLFVTKFNKYVSDDEEQHKFRLGLIYRQNSVNELSGIIAHELKNPLTVILNYVQGCIRRIESKNYHELDILNALKAASEQSNRANELILRLKRFQHNKELHIEKHSIDEMVQAVIKILKNDILDFKVDIQYRSITDCFVKADKLYLEQLLLNLTRNAIDAMRDAKTESPRLIIELNRISSTKLQVMVIDNGPGFPAAISHKLYDPHFTTKPYGVGVGLALSQSIAQAHQSVISGENNTQGGATFQFQLQIC
jgi:two-component system, LuxR family, sensor kinase FixL